MNDSSILAAIGWLTIATAVCFDAVQEKNTQTGNSAILLTAPPPPASPAVLTSSEQEVPSAPGFYPAPMDTPNYIPGPTPNWQQLVRHD